MGNAMGGSTPGRPRLGEGLRLLSRGLRSGGARRARWGIFDQGISSFTNFVITAIVAHEVSPASFGAFSVALAVYVFVLWVDRSMVGEPFVVRFTSSPVSQHTAAAKQAVGAAIVAGMGAGVLAVALGLLAGGATGTALIAMGISLPGLLAQDAYRYVLVSRGRARAAAANDALWLAVQVVAVVVLLLGGWASVTSLVVAFGAGGAVGAVLAAWQTGALPSLNRAVPWFRDHTDLWMPFLLELLSINATPQLSMLTVAALGEVVTVGELRGGMLLFAPLTVLLSGVFLVGLPEAVRLRERSASDLRYFVVSLAVVTVALTLLWAGALSVLPRRAGEEILKSNWASSRRILWPMAAFTAATAAVMAAVVGLRALGAARRTLPVRIWGGPVVFVAGIVGAEVAGAMGAALGLAAALCLNGGLGWLMFWRASTKDNVDDLPVQRSRGSSERSNGDIAQLGKRAQQHL